uniref:ATP synthase complex subunit 8 n=1 Tax=Hyalella kochi TaxID=2759778 RepID=A0A7T8V7D3_9CRUS|nr:ATP synthase F0 subunit 8 [Hyalella kochi]
MPQMAPMLWCVLFLYFILLAVILMKLVFFSSSYSNSTSSIKEGLIKLNWKW